MAMKELMFGALLVFSGRLHFTSVYSVCNAQILQALYHGSI